MTNWKLYQSLHGRGLTQKILAERAGVGRCHLSQVLNNVAGRGKHTRRRLFPWLTHEEIKALGWERDFELWSRHRLDRQCLCSTGSIVPIGTILESRMVVEEPDATKGEAI